MAERLDNSESAVIRVPSLPELISERLRTDITRGVYKPGPVRIGELAKRFGVSAMPVREALRRLEAEGLISFQPNRQITINALTVAEVDEIFEIRLQLEPFAVRMATPRLRRDEATLQELDDLITRLDASGDRPDAWRTLNRTFHDAVYRGAGMPRLEAIINSLWAMIESYIRYYVQAAADVELAQRQHRRLLDLVRKGDADAAASMLAKHIASSHDALVSAMQVDPEASLES
jgi:DNA-binding GntR family transcriptional regulator